MVKVRGRNSNGKTVKQTAEKLARASICDVMVPHWCHPAIMARSRDWIKIFVISRNQPVSSDDMMLTRRWLRSPSRSSSWRSPVMMLRTLTRCHRKFSQLSGTCRLLVGKFRSWTAPMVCSRQTIGWDGLWRACCPSCQNFGAIRFEPKRSFLESARTTLFKCSWLLAHRRQTAKKTTRTYCRFWKSRWNNELRFIRFGWLRSPISIYQESEDSIELLPRYHVPCVTLCSSVLCHRLVK